MQTPMMAPIALRLRDAQAYYQRECDELHLLRRSGAPYRTLANQRAAINAAWAEVERLRALLATDH